MNPFARFFQREQSDADAAASDGLREAQEFIAWAQMPYFQRYMDELADRADKPMAIGDHMAMLQSAVASNTVKELRSVLLSRLQRAEALVARVREERENG